MVQAEPPALPAGLRDLLACRARAWHDRLKAHTFRTVFIDLEDDVLAWLLADGIMAGDANRAFGRRVADFSSGGEESGSDEEATSGEGEEPCFSRDFPELYARIEEAIAELGGSAVPKLTWSTPKVHYGLVDNVMLASSQDAVWLTHDNTMRCSSADEVVLLLKSSDRVAHDLAEAVPEAALASGYQGQLPSPAHFLALREWREILPDREFRCFIVRGELRAISQRDVTHRYQTLLNAGARDQMRDWIEAFVRRVLLRHARMADFAADVVVGPTGRVTLVDLNPAGGTTSPLLFSWEELLGRGGDGRGDQGSGDKSSDDAARCVEGEEAGREGDGQGGAQEGPAGVAGALAGSPVRASAPGSEYLALLRQTRAGSGVPGELAAPARRGQARMRPTHPPSCECCTPPLAPASMPLCELRVVEGDGPMQPNVAAYGVPFDFVDDSEGSALRQLLAQGNQAAGLWKDLAKQAEIR